MTDFTQLPDGSGQPGWMDVWKNFWPIGILSFGGTQANMAMFQTMLVKDLKWVDQAHYAELLGIVQALPGASAAQIVLVTVTVATGRPLAGLLAFMLFVLPGAIGMAYIGIFLKGVDIMANHWVVVTQVGIGCAATVLVINGAQELGAKLITDNLTTALWFITCITCFVVAQQPILLSILIMTCLICGAGAALYAYSDKDMGAKKNAEPLPVGINRGVGSVLNIVVLLVLLVLIVLPLLPDCPAWVKTAAVFYKVGVLVFGGGPVVIPLMLLQLLAEGSMDSHQFLLGFAAVQAFPGPMFNLAAFCGGLLGSWPVAVLAWSSMMVPGALLALGVLPFWADFRRSPTVQRALKGVNACAAGLMGSAVLLLGKTLILDPKIDNHVPQVCITLGILALSMRFKIKPYYLILLGALAGAAAGGITAAMSEDGDPSW